MWRKYGLPTWGWQSKDEWKYHGAVHSDLQCMNFCPRQMMICCLQSSELPDSNFASKSQKPGHLSQSNLFTRLCCNFDVMPETVWLFQNKLFCTSQSHGDSHLGIPPVSFLINQVVWDPERPSKLDWKKSLRLIAGSMDVAHPLFVVGWWQLFQGWRWMSMLYSLLSESLLLSSKGLGSRSEDQSSLQSHIYRTVSVLWTSYIILPGLNLSHMISYWTLPARTSLLIWQC